MRPAFRISISGLDGFVRWPLVDSVAHVVPVDDVVLRGLPSPDCEVDIFHGDTWVTSVSVVVNGSMVLPSHLFDNAIDNRLKLVLKIRGEVYGGYIIFLPVEESEPFPYEGILLNRDGSTGERANYVTTDYIDVEFVDDIVYTGRMRWDTGIAMAAYNQDREFVKILIGRSDNNYVDQHIATDGTYKYIRASSYETEDYMLQVHYKSRRRH